MATTEQYERGRRANIHRWFSQHINIELEPWQLEYICEKLELRTKSADPEETREFEEGGDNIKYVDLVDEDYEEWKRHHERWVREQNSRAIEWKLSNPPLIRSRNVAEWKHFCEHHNGTEIWLYESIKECPLCGYTNPKTRHQPRSWWQYIGRESLGWVHRCFGKDLWNLPSTTEFCGNCGVERP